MASYIAWMFFEITRISLIFFAHSHFRQVDSIWVILDRGKMVLSIRKPFKKYQQAEQKAMYDTSYINTYYLYYL